MSHVRTQIRDQMVTEIDAGVPEFKEVSSTRLYAYRELQLPALNVYVQTEESEVINLGSQLSGAMAKRTMRRQLTMSTEIYQVASEEGIDTDLDRLAVEVEKVMEATLLNGLASDIALVASNYTIDAEGEVPVGILTLSWLIIYRTLEGDPEVSV